MLFKSKREKEILQKQKEIEQTLEEIKAEKALLIKEKEELLNIKQMMENTQNPDRIDISDVYVWRFDGIYSLVRLKEEKKPGTNAFGAEVEGYESTLTDIFTNKIIYKKFSTNKIDVHEIVEIKDGQTFQAFFKSIYYYDRNLLVYVDKKVPKYVLHQLYYKLNNIDISELVINKSLIK